MGRIFCRFIVLCTMSVLLVFVWCGFYEVSVGYIAYICVVSSHSFVDIYIIFHKVCMECLTYDHATIPSFGNQPFVSFLV